MKTKYLKLNWQAFGLATLATCLHGNLFAQGSSAAQSGVPEQEALFYAVAGMLIFVSIAVLIVALYVLQIAAAHFRKRYCTRHSASYRKLLEHI